MENQVKNDEMTSRKKLEKVMNFTTIPILVAICIGFFSAFEFTKNGVTEKLSFASFIIPRNVFNNSYSTGFSWVFLLIDLLLVFGAIVASLCTLKKCNKILRIVFLVVGALMDVTAGLFCFFLRESFLNYANAPELIADVKNGIVTLQILPTAYIQGVLIVLGGVSTIVSGIYLLINESKKPDNVMNNHQ